MEKINPAGRHAWRLAPLLAVALAALGGQACHGMTGLGGGTGAIPDGGYDYTGFASSGAVVVRGWLTLDVTNPAQVTGTWHLEGNRQSIGPQTGDGQLAGSMAGDQLSLNLNPDTFDDNVFLHGTIGGGAYRGRWSYSTLAGVLNEGSFEALQR